MFGSQGVAKKVPLAPTQSKLPPVSENGGMASQQPAAISKGEAKKVRMRPGPVKNAR